MLVQIVTRILSSKSYKFYFSVCESHLHNTWTHLCFFLYAHKYIHTPAMQWPAHPIIGCNSDYMCTFTTVQRCGVSKIFFFSFFTFFLGKKLILIQQVHINWLKVTVNHFICLFKCCAFENSIHQRILKNIRILLCE